MNSLVKFTVDGLRFTVDGLRLTVDRLQLKEGGRRLGRCVMLVAAMLLGGWSARATDYVITYTYNSTTYYIGMNGNSIEAKTSFDPTCIWTCRNGNNDADLSNSTSYSLRNKNNSTYYLTTSCSWYVVTYSWDNLSVQNSARNIWRSSNAIDGNIYAYISGQTSFVTWTRSASIGSNGNALTMDDNNTSGSQNYKVTSVSNTLQDETTLPTISISSYINNTITFGHDVLGGRYVPANSYTIYTFNSEPHNWYNSTDYGSTVPAGAYVNANTLSPTYTWSLTANGGDVASIIPSTGVLTIDDEPTGDITVRLTVSNISPLADKTAEDFTLTKADAAAILPTLSITNSGLSDGGIQLAPSITGSYSPACVSLTNSSTTYYWDATNSVLTTSRPGTISSWGDADITWEVVTGGAYASVDDEGLVTLTRAPAGDIVVRMTVAKEGYEGYTDITLTRTHHDEAVVSVSSSMTAPTVSPASASLDFGEDQTFTASATVTMTTTTTPAYDGLQVGGGSTYYYYSDALHAAVPGNVATVTHPDATYSWSITGDARTNLTPTSGTGATFTATYSHASSAASTTATLTVTASTPGADDQTATATITVVSTLPTGIAVSTSEVALCAGGDESISYILTPVRAADNVTVSSDNACVTASVDNAGTLTLHGVSAGEATVTLTATGPDATPVTCTVSVSVMSSCATPEISFNNGNGKVTIACGTDGATIYYTPYTLDGSTPTDDRSEYEEPFEQTTPVTIKAIAYKEGYCPSAEASLQINKVATPTINITASGVTFSGASAGATYYYNLAGGAPATAWDGATITSGFTSGTAINVVAKKSGWINSETVSKIYYPTTGVSGGVVTLNDIEDHSWAYYSSTELPKMMRSLNPADVKITYYGNGTNNISSTVDSWTPAINSWTQSASTVKVGPNDNYNTFVYYKTLEREDGGTANTVEGATGRCKYTVIPNPFSVRPSIQDGDDYYYSGFYKWRVKTLSGGAIYDAATGDNSIGVGGTIDGDQIVYFAPSSEYGMVVELEALWAVATFSTGTGNLSSYATGTNAYERNFHVVTSSQNASSYQKSYGCTVSSYYPNGTSAGGSVSGAFTAAGPTKFENIAITDAGNRTWNANGKDLVIGRGVTGTVNNLYGLSSNQNTGFRFRIESGTYANLAFMGDNGDYNSGPGLTDGVMTAVMGCDYDRANNDSTKLRVTTDIIMGHSATVGNSEEKGEEIFNCTVKSGNYNLGSYGLSAQFYISNWGNNPATYGKRTLTVEGGNFSDISGGCDDDGTTDVLMVDIRIKGGTMKGAVYGAAQRSEAQGHRRMIITGGDFKGWIAGAANGNDISSTSYTGKLTGNTYLYVGGRARVDSDSSTSLINRSVGGNVFGAGCGYSGSNNIGYVKGNVNVAIADEAYIERGVYGGGSFGYDTTGYTATIYMMGGTVECIGGGVSVNNQGTASYIGTVKGGVYGGACQNKAGSNIVKMYGGRVNGSVYGGCNVTGNPSGNVTVTVNGGTVTGGVFGCNNVAGSPKGTVTVTVNGSDPTVVDGSGNKSYAIGAVYGGGNQAHYDPTTPGSYPTVTVNGCATSIKDVYGGGNAAAVPYTQVTINGGDIDRVFGGGNGESGTPANVGHKNWRENVEHPYTPTNDDVYGTGTATTVIHGGTINQVFGGSNSHGRIRGDITLTLDENGTCPMNLGEVFAGNNLAPRNGSIVATIPCGAQLDEVYGCSNQAAFVGNVTLNILGGTLGRVYGGSKNANITGNVTVNVFGGQIGTVFGGNNVGGNITGTVTVNIDSTVNGCADGFSIDTIYGGGNLAAYVPTASAALSPNFSPVVNIIKGRVNVAVFGGGLGSTAGITANPKVVVGAPRVQTLSEGNVVAVAPAVTDLPVSIGTGKNPNQSSIMGNVFGGGNLAPVNGNTTVILQGSKTMVWHNVYGGGNRAAVSGNTDVQIGE